MNSLTVLHAADLHVGLRFLSHGEASQPLSAARFEVVDRVVEAASQASADILVLAGDLFDRTRIAKTDIERVCESLAGFSGACVLVLPGNHDYFSPESALWSDFCREAGEHVLLLAETGPYRLDDYGLPCDVWAAPCTSKTSSQHVLPTELPATRHPGRFQLGVAHGSLIGVSPDPKLQYYPMTREDLDATGVDIWLLGHTHVPWPEIPDPGIRVYNPGTPEPDGFDYTRSGGVFLHTLLLPEVDSSDESRPESRRAQLTSRFIATGQFRFEHHERTITGVPAEDFLSDIPDHTDAAKTCVRLRVHGRIDPDSRTRYHALRDELRARLLLLEVDESELHTRITADTIGDHFPSASFPAELLTRLSEDGDDEAMDQAFRLLEQVKGS
ncbi:MAG: hypothetical protein EA383_01825 [Spirochaetaceae bacterium]|nr:MAG: hypothetical protein EA383_01825 [Spirochaetaceae bacterium]